MSFVLRQVRKNRWYKDEAASLLSVNDVPADPLGDLQTQSNKLSVWLIDDKKSNVDQIVTALAAGRDAPSNLDYALLDAKYLKRSRLKIKHSEGGTLDNSVNEYHSDVTELSGIRLVRLARVFLRFAEIKRIPEKNVKELVQQAIKSRRIDANRIKWMRGS